MNSLFIKVLILLSIFNCNDRSSKTVESTVEIDETVKQEEATEKGFLFIKISKIYHRGGQIVVLDGEKKSKITFKDKIVTINDNDYDIINEEHLYKNFIEVESFFPEYGLFILKANKQTDGFYEIQINNENGFIDGNKYSDILIFKKQEQFVLDGYPYLTKKTPLRKNPDDNAEIIPNYFDYTYLSVEIKGDWLKVKDDKDCYPGEEPSEKDIIGWVRWKKESEIIIDIRHKC